MCLAQGHNTVTLVGIEPSQQFFTHAGTEPTLPGFNQYCRGLMCLAQGHNTVTLVGIDPRTSRFGVRRSTTTPPRPLRSILVGYIGFSMEKKRENSDFFRKFCSL